MTHLCRRCELRWLKTFLAPLLYARQRPVGMLVFAGKTEKLLALKSRNGITLAE
jgi:hypothetical protein